MHGPLESFWCIHETKEHPRKPEQYLMCIESSQLLSFVVHRYLPIATVGIQGGENVRVSKGKLSIVHMEDRVSIPLGHRI